MFLPMRLFDVLIGGLSPFYSIIGPVRRKRPQYYHQWWNGQVLVYRPISGHLANAG